MKVRMKLELDHQRELTMVIRVPYGTLDLHLQERSPKLIQRLLTEEVMVELDDFLPIVEDSGPF